MQVRVKICGITTFSDALAAVQAGADALGFVFYEKSPRHVTPAQAARIIRELPPFVSRVGLFVDASEDQIRATLAEARIDTLQLHGEESPEFCGRFATTVLKAVRVRSRRSLKGLGGYPVSGILLDSFVPGQPGGTGASFNWELALEAKHCGRPIILAGGLKPENVARAVAAVNPYGVDVSSGVESSPGRKDVARMRDFIAAARRD
jgi:phosphoribosylanthranilate isomerase